jgi:hypothetical protein
MAGPSLLFREIAADRRSDPEQPEVGPGHLAAGQPLGDRTVAEGHGPPPVAGDCLELALLRFEREVVRHGKRVLVGRGVRVDADQALRIPVRQRLEQRRVHGREDRRGGADAQADGDDDRQRERGGAEQVAETDPDVLREILNEQSSLHASLLFEILAAAVPSGVIEVAELPRSLAARLVGRDSVCPQLVDPHLEVHAELFVHLVADRLRPASHVPEAWRPHPG